MVKLSKACSAGVVFEVLHRLFPSSLLIASVSKQVQVHILSYGNDFDLQDNKWAGETLPYERLRKWTRVETETKENLEMAAMP